MPRTLLMLLVLALPAVAHAQPTRASLPAPVVPADRGVDDRSAPDLWLATHEGHQTLRLLSVMGNELLGAMATWDVEAETHDASFDATELLGHLVTLGARTGPTSFRIRNAHVLSVIPHERDETGRQRVSLSLGTWMDVLHHAVNVAAFENASALDVIRAVAGRYPFARVDIRVRSTVAIRPLIVQYGESDFELLMRMIAEEGLFCYLQHSAHDHTLVITDHDAGPRRTPIVLDAGGNDPARSVDVGAAITRVESTGFRLRARDPRRPGHETFAERHAPPHGPLGPLVVTDTYGPWSSAAAAERIAASRLAAFDAHGGFRAHTESGLVDLGDIVSLRGARDRRAASPHRVVALMWHAEDGSRFGSPHRMMADLELRPADGPVVAPLRRMSVVHGPQLGLVLGPRAGQVHSDSDGRVRVRLPWGPTPTGQPPEVWVPVIGGTWRPPAGERVLLHYVDGDPAQPLIVAPPAATP